MSKRALIAGAGVGGPTLAFWLQRYGYDVTVVERAPGLRPGGHAVDFRGSGLRVLERMELVDEITRLQTRTGAITIVDQTNRVVARLPDGFTSGDLEVFRADLVRVLYEATREHVEYIFDDAITSIDQSANYADVVLASGKSGRYDLVVGADGLHSGVRRMVFGPEAGFVRHMGYYIAIYTIPDFMGLGDTGRYYVQRGKRVGCFGSASAGAATASFYFASDRLDYDRRDTAAQKQLLREVFADVKWEAPRMLDMLDSAPDFYFDSLSQVRMDTWAAGRVVLLGDAAACASPMAGMGTTIAMVGAYVLAGELRKAPDHPAAAFAAYEAAMRNFVAEAQKMAESVSWFVPQTRLKLWLSNRMWSWMPQSTLRQLMIEEPARVAGLVSLDAYD